MYSGRHQRTTARIVEFADAYLFQPCGTYLIGQHCHHPCRFKAATRPGIGFETGSQARHLRRAQRGFAYLALSSRIQKSALLISFPHHATQYLVWQIVEHIKEPYNLPNFLALYHPALIEMLHSAIPGERTILSTGHEDEIQESSINPLPRSSSPSEARRTERPRQQNGKFECVYCEKEFSSMYNLR
jgi:hypothetical protein